MTLLFIFHVLFILTSICHSYNISCVGHQECKDENKICLNDQQCDITCDGGNSGQQACQHATLNGSSATHVSLNCVGKQDCQDTELICGSGICSVNCYDSNDNNNEQQCISTKVQCGEGPCKIHCNDTRSCEVTFTIPPSTVSFECTGECDQISPSPFVHTTLSPTSIPTTIPTMKPTSMPTIIPTSIPTMIPIINPATNPTMNPTNYFDTDYPTRNPTQVPILSATKPQISNPTENITNTYLTLNPSVNIDIGIIDTERDNFGIKMILNDTVLIIIFSLIALVVICMGFICMFYVYTMRKKKQKHISDQSVENKQPKYNNIPMNVSKEFEENNTEIRKSASISEHLSFKDDAQSNAQSNEPPNGECTAIQMGELDISASEINELINENNVKETDSYKCKNTLQRMKTPSASNSFDIELNDNEFIISGDSDTENDNGKGRKITEGQ